MMMAPTIRASHDFLRSESSLAIKRLQTLTCACNWCEFDPPAKVITFEIHDPAF
jgi:hypothetical protein